VVPLNLTSKVALLTFLGQAVPLPAYFGHNWDALEECLGDLNGGKHQKIALIHQDLPLPNLPTDQRIYLQILENVARNSDRIAVIFPEEYRQQIRQLLSSVE